MRDGERWVGDSWDGVLYLDREYPDRPTLLAGAAGPAHARLVAALCGTQLFPAAVPIAVYQAYKLLDEGSTACFRASREAMSGRSLEPRCPASRP